MHIQLIYIYLCLVKMVFINNYTYPESKMLSLKEEISFTSENILNTKSEIILNDDENCLFILFFRFLYFQK